MTTGLALIEEINRAEVPAGGCSFWWLGQHSFVLKLAGKVIYLDPFVSPHKDRLVACPLKAGEITHADLILGTHDHLDHIDRPALPAMMAASPAARLLVPELPRGGLIADLKLPPQRIVGLDDGDSVEVNGIKIFAVAAAHELLNRDERTGHYPFLGYILQADGLTIYHAGDCCLYEGLITKLKRWRFDIAFLPINGRDARRLRANCLGNMTYQEAADLAGAIEPALTVPAHYGMFAFNTQEPRDFVEYMDVKYPQRPVRVCEIGRMEMYCKQG